MRGRVDSVLEAIERWQSAGLIDVDTAQVLRSELSGFATARSRRLSQYVLAATGGVVLLIAGGLFLDWAWPLLPLAGRSFVLAAVGIGVVALGLRMEDSRRWLPAAYLLQTSGLGLLLAAFAYSEGAWADMSAGGVAVGVTSLVVPLVLAPRAMRRGEVMPAVHLAMGLGFLAVFLERATPLSGDDIIWVLDAALVAAMGVLVRMLARDPAGERYPWVLNAFVMSMAAGFALIFFTALGPLSLNDDAMWPLDAWLLMIAGLTVWGVERAPVSLRREWYGQLLAYLLLIWIVFGFVTTLSTMNGPPELALLVVGGAGVVAFMYANRRELRGLMASAALAFIAPLWYWAIDRGGALGAVAALAATAGILFWTSGRTGPVEPAG